MAQRYSDEWLAGAACHSCAHPALPHRSAVRLSELPSKQKRELAGVVAAALATTAFALLPALSPESLRVPLPSSAMTLQFAPMPDAERGTATLAAVVVPRTAELAPRLRRARALAPRLASEAVVGARATAPTIIEPVGTAGTLAEARTIVAPPTEKHGGNALTRALLGTGRHKVRPFPVPNGNNDQ